MFKSLMASVMFAAVSISPLASASAQVGRFDSGLRPFGSMTTEIQYRRHGGYRHYGYGGRRGVYYGRRGGHFPVGAGVAAGLAAGAILGGAIAAQGQPAYVEPPGEPQGEPADYCVSRFKSYDPQSGTYLGFDGQRHPCP